MRPGDGEAAGGVPHAVAQPRRVVLGVGVEGGVAVALVVEVALVLAHLVIELETGSRGLLEDFIITEKVPISCPLTMS